jgi:uncharacterized protein (TIGR03437 family)
MTGGGALNPSVPDGTIIGKNPPLLQSHVTASIFGVPAEVVYAGAAPTLVAGVVQINVRVPAGVPVNNFLPVVVNIGQDSQPLVNMSVR